jgi:hypothetical protein
MWTWGFRFLNDLSSVSMVPSSHVGPPNLSHQYLGFKWLSSWQMSILERIILQGKPREASSARFTRVYMAFTRCSEATALTSSFIPRTLQIWPLSIAYIVSGRSKLASTLGSWVRITLKTWTFMCIYSMFVSFYVYAEALQRADPPSKEIYRLCIGLRNWKSGQGPTKGS